MRVTYDFLLFGFFGFSFVDSQRFLRHLRSGNLSAVQRIQSMNDIVLVQSKNLDIFGKYYYFLVFNNRHIDKYVSPVMIKTGGAWELFLNSLLRFLVNEQVQIGEDPKALSVIDAGANVGAFSLYAGSLGCRVFAFEMQPLVHLLLELSVRISGYRDRVQVFNVPLWNYTREVYFTPVQGNLGGLECH